MDGFVKHLHYLKYVLKHKWWVFYCGLHTHSSLWRLVIHDWSKFSAAEWMPYVNFFYGSPERTSATKTAFSRAFHHHIHRNPHHWEYWLRYKASDGSITSLKMPEKFVREMVADWAGAGRAITGKWELESWYADNRMRIKLHSQTRMLVETLVKQLSRSLEKR